MSRSVLAERDFRLILFAWGVSMVGDFLAVIALTLRVEDATGSGIAVAGLLLASGVPAALLTPVGGWLVDRLETSRVLAATATAQALVAAALALFDSVAATIPLAFLLGCGLAVEGPALFALVPRVVGERRGPNASAWLESARYCGLTIGVLAGGVVTGALGSRTALAVDAATFVVAAVAALALRTRRPPAAPQPEDGSRFTVGLRVLTGDGVLRASVLLLGATVLFAALTNVAEVFYAQDDLGAGATGYGALAAAWGLGMVVGALAIGRGLTGSSASRALVLATLGTGGALSATAVAPTLAIALVLFLIGGAANGVENVAMRVLIQTRVAERLRGRAYGAYQGVMTPVDFLALAAGGLAVELLGPRGTIGLAGAGSLTAGLIGATVLRGRLRDRSSRA